ncbi:hypothetical protein [Corynebacterium sp. 335C]
MTTARRAAAPGPRRAAGMRGGRARRLAAAALACAAVAGAAACSSADPRVVDRTWQVTGVFDDPALPQAPVEGEIPPTLVFGGTSYTGSSACGEFRGDVDWVGDGVARVGAPEWLRTRDCSANASEYDRRLFGVLPGEQRLAADGDSLRASLVAEHPPGTAARGFAAVQIAAG